MKIIHHLLLLKLIQKVEQENPKKKIQKEKLYLQMKDGSQVPATQTIINPKIEGVIVTAVGASDANIKANIIAAVEAVTGVATHKIQVFSM